MARRKVDVNMLAGLVQGSATQELQKGTPRTTDPNFPVFTTPVNQDILVYIPTTNVVKDENGSNMNVLNSLIHEGKNGKQFVSLRCISGLTGNALFEELGYDGTCPCCDATQEVWELYRHKLGNEASRLGIDPQNDPSDTLKPIREKILGEMDLKGAEEFVTFPIVIIPTKGKFTPADDALETMQVVFVHWRKKRYNDSILGALEQLMSNPGHPAGLFWFWKFSYDTQGKQPTAMASAKNAKYSVIQDQAGLASLERFKAVAEQKAAEFTLLKAAEVVVATQFVYKDDLLTDVNKIMQKTRTLNELAGTQGGQPAIGTGQPAGQLGGANPLANFGVAQPDATAPQGQLGVTPEQAPVQGNPVSFG